MQESDNIPIRSERPFDHLVGPASGSKSLAGVEADLTEVVRGTTENDDVVRAVPEPEVTPPYPVKI